MLARFVNHPAPRRRSRALLSFGSLAAILLCAAFAPLPAPPPAALLAAPGTVSGSLVVWGDVRVDFAGPGTSESATPNPFHDLRLDVTFRHTASGKQVVVPGYYAADGVAADSGANSGSIWRAHLLPDLAGTWTYTASFRAGSGVAKSLLLTAGTPTGFDGSTGTFQVGPVPAAAKGFRKDGLLSWTNGRYLRFAGTGRPFLKTGTDSPENLLAYQDFDATTPSHAYATHVADWKPGDPTWAGNRGKGLIGALNYLSSAGVNSAYFLTFNVGGDGNDVWPWTSSSQRVRFDVSRLAQWGVVFEHMTKLGILIHVVTQETENDNGELGLDGGELLTQRKLYYRELVARFSHYPAMQWNLGEENSNTTAQQLAFIAYIRALDPYDHPITVHTFPTGKDYVFLPLMNAGALEMAALQVLNMETAHAETLQWVQASEAAGRPWAVTVDEIGPPNTGVLPDSLDPSHDSVRRHVLWGNFMAGGAGCEWYFGYSYPDNDLNCENFRSRAAMWEQSRVAREFFQAQLQDGDLQPSDGLVSAVSATGGALPAWCLAAPSQQYVVYLPQGGSAALDLQGATGSFDVSWYDTLLGGELQDGTVTTVSGPGTVSLGHPPHSPQTDWAAVVRLSGANQEPPTITGLTVQPSVFAGWQSFAVTMDVTHPLGNSAIEGVAVHFFAPGMVHVGWAPATQLSSGKYSLSIPSLPALPAGQWTVVPVAVDSVGQFSWDMQAFTAL